MIYHNKRDDKYYVDAESNLYRTRIMYKGIGYPSQHIALQGAVLSNIIIPLDDNLNMDDGNGGGVSFKNTVETICD